MVDPETGVTTLIIPLIGDEPRTDWPAIPDEAPDGKVTQDLLQRMLSETLLNTVRLCFPNDSLYANRAYRVMLKPLAAPLGRNHLVYELMDCSECDPDGFPLHGPDDYVIGDDDEDAPFDKTR